MKTVTVWDPEDWGTEYTNEDRERWHARIRRFFQNNWPSTKVTIKTGPAARVIVDDEVWDDMRQAIFVDQWERFCATNFDAGRKLTRQSWLEGKVVHVVKLERTKDNTGKTISALRHIDFTDGSRLTFRAVEMSEQGPEVVATFYEAFE